jgi:hypothetical protein
MNMQTIQITILLLDHFIKLAPWRLVAKAIHRISRASTARFAHSIRSAIAVFVGLGLILSASLFGPALVADYIAGVMPQQVSRGGLVFDCRVLALCVVLTLWTGVWWRDRNVRAGVSAVLDGLMGKGTIHA